MKSENKDSISAFQQTLNDVADRTKEDTKARAREYLHMYLSRPNHCLKTLGIENPEDLSRDKIIALLKDRQKAAKGKARTLGGVPHNYELGYIALAIENERAAYETTTSDLSRFLTGIINDADK